MTGLLTGPDARPRRALVLAGGGMRVAWQSGVVTALQDAGLAFAHVDGASGGTMTAAMLLSGLSPAEMVQRWDTLDVHEFSALLPLTDYLRGPAQLPALGDASGVRDEVFPHLGIDLDAVRAATARTGAVGTFNVCDFTAKTCVAMPNDQMSLDLLVAAVSLPVVMPAVEHAGRTYTDAVWIKDANVLEAVRRGAEEVWLVWCIGNTPRYGAGPLEQYVHMIEMSASGGLFAELSVVADINARRRAGEPVLGSTTPVVLHVVKPAVPLPLDPDFFAGRITAATLVDMGHRDACAYLAVSEPGGVPLDESATAMADLPLGVRVRERLHGSLDGLGEVDLEVVSELRDIAAFADDTAVPTPLVGHLDLLDHGERVLVRGGDLSVADDEVRYRLELRLAAGPTTLLGIKSMGASAGLDAWNSFSRMQVRSGERDLGELRMRWRDAAEFVAAIEPSGAHDLADRGKAVADVTRLLWRRGDPTGA
jgi:predicted acylesterase/phospholipase RssA